MMNRPAIILVRDPAALARCLQKLIGLPTLKRSAIALQRLTGLRSLVCLPDEQSLQLCRQKIGDVADWTIGTGAARSRLESLQADSQAEVLFLDSDLIAIPALLQTITTGALPLRLAAPGGLIRLPLTQALETLKYHTTPDTLSEALNQIPAKILPAQLGVNIARLDLEGGRPLGNKILSLSVRCWTDSFLGALNRSIALPLTRGFARVGFSPNAVSFLALALVILGAWAFTQGTYGGFLSGALLTYLSTLLDFSDGDLARLTYRESKFGCWLDSACDYLSYFFTFGGIFVGAYRAQILRGSALLIWILSGLVISISVFVLYRIWLAKKDGRPDQMDAHLQIAMKRMSDDPGIRLANILAKIPTRGDSAYIILGFALFGQIHGLLILTAVAAHTSWILALYVGWRAKQRGLFEPAAILQPLPSESAVDGFIRPINEGFEPVSKIS